MYLCMSVCMHIYTHINVTPAYTAQFCMHAYTCAYIHAQRYNISFCFATGVLDKPSAPKLQTHESSSTRQRPNVDS